MFPFAFYSFLFVQACLIASKFSAVIPATTDLILLNCGAPSYLYDTNGRSWKTDVGSKYAPPNATRISSAHNASDFFFPDAVPYRTARVFLSHFTYTFPVLRGPKFLRLYFYPTMYSVYNASLSFFSVTANGFTLLSNFSAFSHYRQPNNAFMNSVFLNSPRPNHAFMKEFVINFEEEQRLNLTFSPDTNSSAFVNGIEIVSIPDDLYYRGVQIKFFDQIYYLKNDTALENLYRLNVGGSNVEIQDDSGDMFRTWVQDDPYIMNGDFGYKPPRPENLQIKYTPETPPSSAPPIVYTTSRTMGLGTTSRSLEWAFPVDSGFLYLLRLHFCEIQLEVTKQNERVFTISINNQTAEFQANVIFWTGGNGIPVFKDYVAWVPDDGRRGKKELRLSLFPNLEGRPKYSSALLNGLEIFKLSDSIPSLAVANPDAPINNSSPPETALKPPRNKKSGSSVIYAVIGSGIGVLAVAVFSFLILRWRQKLKDSVTAVANSSWVSVSTSSISTTKTTVPLLSDLCRHFSLKEIKTATANFEDQFIIGRGGFGNVYKGFIDDGASSVAIKRLNPSSSQGISEFLTEIQMLSKLRHTHLVSLIGYCDENGEMVLVYDYMEHGTVRDHLCNWENTPLTWKQRLQICIGAAKGLHYLHSGTENTVIHRDVKSTNILLDENWVAKISDFGLSKMGPVNESFTHISTNIKGTYGYLDPEYFSSHQLTTKSDVYAFGVVLFEVLSGRPAVDMTLEEEEQHSLAQWARCCIRDGKLNRLIDQNLAGQISPACLQVFAEIAGRCLLVRPHGRPAMADIVMGLELASSRQSDDPTECSNNLEHYF